MIKSQKDILEKIKKLPRINFEDSFNFIKLMQKENSIKLCFPEINKESYDAKIHFENLDLKLECEFPLYSEIALGTSYRIEIVLEEKKYHIPKFFFSKQLSIELNQNNIKPIRKTLVGNIFNLSTTTNAKSDNYHRLIIPVNSNCDLHNYIHTLGFNDESYYYAVGKVDIKVSGISFFLYEKKYNDKKYLIIDTRSKIKFDEFEEYYFSILLSLGFLSAKLYLDNGYFISSNNKNFNKIDDTTYQRFRDSIFSSFNPLQSRLILGLNKKGRPDIKELHLFDMNLFSNLCTKIKESKGFMSLIFLLLESNVSSLSIRPVGYSVVLEMLTNIIAMENKGLKPIIKKSTSKEFSKELFQVLDKYKDQILKEGKPDSVTILQKKIGNINTPTNRDKLTKPFEIYGIDLLPDEEYAIDNRNNFLHGNEIKFQDILNTKDYFKHIHCISLRLNFLVNRLILKYLGFEGEIINHVKLHENIIGKVINEDVVRNV